MNPRRIELDQRCAANPGSWRSAVRVLGRVAGLVMLVAALVLIPAMPASAHAELATTDPADGSVAETAPKVLTLQFTERVSVQPDGVRVLGADGQRVDAGAASASGDTVAAPLDSTVADGGYVVAWRVVSADGHPVRGAFAFSVGERTELRAGLANDAFAGSADTRDDVIGALLRGLAYLGVLGATGAVLVGAALRRDDEPSPVGRVVTALGCVGLAAVLLQIPVRAALATGRGWGSVADAGVLRLALADGVGWSIALTGAGLLALVVTAGLPFRGAVRALAQVGAVVAPLGLVITGHTRTMSPAAVGYAADSAHVLAGAAWFGGLGALLAVVRRRRGVGDASGAADAVARFSGWAAITLAVVVVAGTTLAWIEVGGLDPLTGTSYGRLLLLKVGFVALAVAAAAWNRFRLVPSLPTSVAEVDRSIGDPGIHDDHRSAVDHGEVDRGVIRERAGRAPTLALGRAGNTTTVTARTSNGGTPGPGDRDLPVPVGPGRVGSGDADQANVWAHLMRVVRFEVVAIVAVLAVTAVLSNVTPAESSADGGVQTVSAPLGDGRVEVLIDPSRPGRNDIHAYLLDADDRPDDRFDDATFQLALPAQDLGPLDREPVRAGPSHFQLVGTDLDLAGEWTLTITVKPDRFTEQTATVTFRVR